MGVTVTITHNPLSVENLKVLLDKVGMNWTARIRQYFEIGGPDEDKWKKTQKPQKAAILNKIKNSGGVLKIEALRMFFDDAKKPLVGEGTLRDSWSYNVQTSGSQVTLRVGSTIEYAKKHQLGESESIPITASMKEAMKSLLKSKSKDRKKIQFLQYFLDKNEYRFKLRKRMLIMWDSVLRGEVNKMFTDFIYEMNKISKNKRG